ncbi:MAG TPA: hypothetical protein VMW27_28420 [Thermoanaerobaculia bacterium]|nr:hypothetical protein [Thermoanaerobaculia bacterium]
MITGYNTDVRHKEVVFHVQTEDKGASNPFIESLVYVGGQVLASKRASYASLLEEGKEKEDIVALMDHQHRTMIAAIRHGKLDDKLAALLAGRQTGQHAAPLASGPVPVPPPIPAPAPPPVLVPVPSPAAVPPPSLSDSASLFSTPAPGARPAAADRTLDQVILEYLTSEADQEQLVLLLDGEQELAMGRRAALTLRTSSSKSGRPVSGAQITVKMISTVAEPSVLATGRTDDDGQLPLLLQIPQLGRGTAALIITAVSAIGRAELKHLL